MKHFFALVCLIFFFAAALGAQDTVRVTACTRYWKNQQPIKNTIIFVETGGISHSASTGPGQHCTEMVVPVVGLLANARVTAYADKVAGSGPEDWAINGVTVGDAMRVSCHILGLAPLPTPQQMIAADINKSGSITTFDIVELRKVVLGIYPEWPNNEVWRLPTDNFPDPSNPFGQPTGGYTLTQFKAFHNDTLIVLGTKTGDVDGDVNLTGTYTGPPQIADTLLLTMPNGLLPANTTVEVPISIAAPSVGGFQVEFKTVPGVNIVGFSAVHSNLNVDYSILSDNTYGLVALRSNAAPIFPGACVNMRISSTQAVALQDVLSIGNGIPFLGFTYCDASKASRLMLQFAGTLPAGGPAKTPLRATPAAPNPFTDKALVNIELPEAMPVLLEVFDLGGRLTWQQEQVLGSGQQQLEIPAEAIAPGSMGLYRVRAGAGVATGKVVRL